MGIGHNANAFLSSLLHCCTTLQAPNRRSSRVDRMSSGIGNANAFLSSLLHYCTALKRRTAVLVDRSHLHKPTLEAKRRQ